MTVVLDTNVLVAALVANGLCRELVHRLIRQHALATSPALLQELESTLRRQFAITPSVSAFLEQLRATVRLVEPAALPAPVCRKAADDVVLATAVAAGAPVIVTGDQDLLVLRSHETVEIMSPRAFLERLERPAGRRRR